MIAVVVVVAAAITDEVVYQNYCLVIDSFTSVGVGCQESGLIEG